MIFIFIYLHKSLSSNQREWFYFPVCVLCAAPPHMNKVRSILQLIISARPAMKAIEKESQSQLFTIIHGGKLRKKANANIFAGKKEMNFGPKAKGLNRISDWILWIAVLAALSPTDPFP
jgi:hypothetical protein